MTTLTWQTLLLLAITYFAGCCIGCLARRAVWRRRARPEPRPAAEPLAAGAAAGAAVLPRSDRADATAPAAEPFRRADASAPRARPAMDAPSAMPDTASGAARFRQALENGGRSAVDRAEPVAPAAAADDDLKRIRAIDAQLEARINSLGVGTYAAIAQWTAADTARMSRELGFKGRIEQENWIEQAQILAKGGTTRYAERLARGEAAAARPIEDEGEPRAPVAAVRPAAAASRPAVQAVAGAASLDAGIGPDVAGRAAFAQERPRQAAAAPLEAPARPLAKSGRDDLQRIRGINAEIETLLNGQGVVRYAQIASWSRVDTGRFDGLLGQDGRIARENWIEQAQILSKGGDTAYSRDYDRGGSGAAAPAGPGAPPGRASELAALRSVRSEAYRTGDAAAIGGAGRVAAPDDLKRIRGIGLLIEKELNRLGVASYEHIANWTAADIDRVSRVLDFKGRIERENWVEQARILASGGQTEFSRRLDRSAAARLGP